MGQHLPKASNYYDDAVERMPYVAPALNRVQEAHLLEYVESAWRAVIDDPGGVTGVLQSMQQTLLASAEAVKAAMDLYVATDEASALRLAEARFKAAEDGFVPPLNPTVDLD